MERDRWLFNRLYRHLAPFPPFRFPQGHGARLQPDWPFTYEDLAPWYETHDQIVGVSGLLGDPAIPPARPVSDETSTAGPAWWCCRQGF